MDEASLTLATRNINLIWNRIQWGRLMINQHSKSMFVKLFNKPMSNDISKAPHLAHGTTKITVLYHYRIISNWLVNVICDDAWLGIYINALTAKGHVYSRVLLIWNGRSPVFRGHELRRPWFSQSVEEYLMLAIVVPIKHFSLKGTEALIIFTNHQTYRMLPSPLIIHWRVVCSNKNNYFHVLSVLSIFCRAWNGNLSARNTNIRSSW